MSIPLVFIRIVYIRPKGLAMMLVVRILVIWRMKPGIRKPEEETGEEVSFEIEQEIEDI